MLDCLYFGLGHRIFPIISVLFLYYYLEPFIHSFPLLSCLPQFSTSPLKSMMNINYVLIYKNSTVIAFDFSLTCPYSFPCLFWFPIILCEVKSMSPLFLFYPLTSCLCSCLFFHFALTIFFSHCLQIVYGHIHHFIQVASKCKYSPRKITEWQRKIMLWNKHCIFNWLLNRLQLNKCLIAVLRETRLVCFEIRSYLFLFLYLPFPFFSFMIS